MYWRSVPAEVSANVKTILILTLISGGAYAEESIAVTHHSITLNGHALNYTARAGRLPIIDTESGEIHGLIFFVSYTADRPPSQKPRPITFVWNGGPGANSTAVHLLGFGPKHIKGEDDPVHPPPVELKVEDNQGTWLDRTDLVFVDPVGTGFSRVTKPQYESEFYSVLGDIAEIAEFIRVYRARFEGWDAPIFLAGESYGTWRASGVAETLERSGVRVAGVILISGGIQVGSVGTDEMKTALFMPRFTAAAFFHHKLPPDLQSNLQAALEKAGTWARNDYGPGLEHRDKVTAAERQAIIAKLAYFTGLDPAQIEKENFSLTLASSQFNGWLLRDQKLTLGRLDMRLTTQKTPLGQAEVISRYLRSELQYKTDLAYQGVEHGYTSAPVRGIGQKWNWNQAKIAPPNPATHPIYGLDFDRAAAAEKDAIVVGSGNGPPVLAEPWLRRAMTIDAALRVYVAAGRYDSLNSCEHNAYIITQIEPQFGRNMKSACYAGGHMIYVDRDARLQLKKDIDAFIAAKEGSR
jgi:carboxypeptidase C (cathepsin A)